jgi:hypothetical protein
MPTNSGIDNAPAAVLGGDESVPNGMRCPELIFRLELHNLNKEFYHVR